MSVSTKKAPRKAAAKPKKAAAIPNRKAPARNARASADADVSAALQLQIALSALKKASARKELDNHKRFGIEAQKALGVSMANIKKIAKSLGRSHELAEALWETGWYEARSLCAFVDEPERVTAEQMDRWAKDFDNWGIVDTLCFHLFDKTPHAWAKAKAWSGRREEFVKRAGFALMAALALHDKGASNRQFLDALRLIEREANDDRNFVKKGVSWALRVIGRRNAALNKAAIEVSTRLTASSDPSAKWIGKGAVKELTGPVVRRALARKK